MKNTAVHCAASRVKSLWLLFCLAGCFTLYAQYPTYKDCPDLTDDDFELEILVKKMNLQSMHEPIDMDFAPDDQGNAHFYFVEQLFGQLSYYDAVSGTVSKVAKLDVHTKREHGVIGIVMDPDFKNNSWIYIQYNPAEEPSFRLSRFTITTDNKLDMSSEKVILEFPSRRTYHTGGDMVFDKHGHLWLTVGEQHWPGTWEPRYYQSTTDKNRSGEWGTSNTRSLWGSVVRIHPEDDGTYTIPKDNFGEYFARYWEETENDLALAGQYRDPDLVRPELYAKGFRNPYTITYDRVTGWITTSDCGSECRNYSGYDPSKPWCPEGAKGEEHNLIKEPGFFGWPYFHGLNHHWAQSDDLKKDPLRPVNDSPFNDGVKVLPPAIPATHAYPQACSITGPIYRYDGALQSNIKLPPHFDGKWFVTDWREPPLGSWIKLVSLSDNGENIGVSDNLFTHLQSRTGITKPIHMMQGPDGAVYIINYKGQGYGSDQGTSVARIIYTGNCRPEITSTGIKSPGGHIKITGGNVSIQSPGQHTLAVFGVRGSLIRSITGTGPKKYYLDELRVPGVYIVRVETEGDYLSRKIVGLQH